jgi:hypothetical protein
VSRVFCRERTLQSGWRRFSIELGQVTTRETIPSFARTVSFWTRMVDVSSNPHHAAVELQRCSLKRADVRLLAEPQNRRRQSQASKPTVTCHLRFGDQSILTRTTSPGRSVIYEMIRKPNRRRHTPLKTSSSGPAIGPRRPARPTTISPHRHVENSGFRPASVPRCP